METKRLDPLNDGLSNLELIRTSGSDLDVVNAARVSYGKESSQFTERDEKLIAYLIKHEHTSPFEHTQLVFRVKTPLFIQRQWMRHRIGVSYNEISGRYAESSLNFYIPKNWRVQDPQNKQGSIGHELIINSNNLDYKEKYDIYLKALNMAKEAYKSLLEKGVCRELARGVLPFCTYTEFIFTCNLVSLFHFLRLRLDQHAQWEMQQYAKGLLQLAETNFPISIRNWLEIKGLEIKKVPINKGQQSCQST